MSIQVDYPLPSDIPVGKRFTTLFGYASALLKSKFDINEVFHEVLRVAKEKCSPPLPTAEVALIVYKAVDSTYPG